MEHFLNGELNFSSRHSFTIYALSPEFITYTNFCSFKKSLNIPKSRYNLNLNCVYTAVKFESKKLFENIRQLEKLDYDPICLSVVLPEGITLTSVTVEGCPETETYYLGRDYTPRASQLNIIHLKASAFAVSLRCHP